jgi:hypothetical protein
MRGSPAHSTGPDAAPSSSALLADVDVAMLWAVMFFSSASDPAAHERTSRVG